MNQAYLRTASAPLLANGGRRAAEVDDSRCSSPSRDLSVRQPVKPWEAWQEYRGRRLGGQLPRGQRGGNYIEQLPAMNLTTSSLDLTSRGPTPQDWSDVLASPMPDLPEAGATTVRKKLDQARRAADWLDRPGELDLNGFLSEFAVAKDNMQDARSRLQQCGIALKYFDDDSTPNLGEAIQEPEPAPFTTSNRLPRETELQICKRELSQARADLAELRGCKQAREDAIIELAEVRVENCRLMEQAKRRVNDSQALSEARVRARNSAQELAATQTQLSEIKSRAPQELAVLQSKVLAVEAQAAQEVTDRQKAFEAKLEDVTAELAQKLDHEFAQKITKIRTELNEAEATSANSATEKAAIQEDLIQAKNASQEFQNQASVAKCELANAQAKATQASIEQQRAQEKQLCELKADMAQHEAKHTESLAEEKLKLLQLVAEQKSHTQEVVNQLAETQAGLEAMRMKVAQDEANHAAKLAETQAGLEAMRMKAAQDEANHAALLQTQLAQARVQVAEESLEQQKALESQLVAMKVKLDDAEHKAVLQAKLAQEQEVAAHIANEERVKMQKQVHEATSARQDATKELATLQAQMIGANKNSEEAASRAVEMQSLIAHAHAEAAQDRMDNKAKIAEVIAQMEREAAQDKMHNDAKLAEAMSKMEADYVEITTALKAASVEERYVSEQANQTNIALKKQFDDECIVARTMVEQLAQLQIRLTEIEFKSAQDTVQQLKDREAKATEFQSECELAKTNSELAQFASAKNKVLELEMAEQKAETLKELSKYDRAMQSQKFDVKNMAEEVTLLALQAQAAKVGHPGSDEKQRSLEAELAEVKAALERHRTEANLGAQQDEQQRVATEAAFSEISIEVSTLKREVERLQQVAGEQAKEHAASRAAADGEIAKLKDALQQQTAVASKEHAESRTAAGVEIAKLRDALKQQSEIVSKATLEEHAASRLAADAEIAKLKDALQEQSTVASKAALEEHAAIKAAADAEITRLKHALQQQSTVVPKVALEEHAASRAAADAEIAKLKDALQQQSAVASKAKSDAYQEVASIEMMMGKQLAAAHTELSNMNAEMEKLKRRVNVDAEPEQKLRVEAHSLLTPLKQEIHDLRLSLPAARVEAKDYVFFKAGDKVESLIDKQDWKPRGILSGAIGTVLGTNAKRAGQYEIQFDGVKGLLKAEHLRLVGQDGSVNNTKNFGDQLAAAQEELARARAELQKIQVDVGKVDNLWQEVLNVDD